MAAANREHRGRQVLSLYVDVLQLRQTAQLLQAMLGVGPAEEREVFQGRQVRDRGKGVVVKPQRRAILGE